MNQWITFMIKHLEWFLAVSIFLVLLILIFHYINPRGKAYVTYVFFIILSMILSLLIQFPWNFIGLGMTFLLTFFFLNGKLFETLFTQESNALYIQPDSLVWDEYEEPPESKISLGSPKEGSA